MRQITRAMEMVAAAKLRRAQMQVTANRPFSRQLREVLARLATAARSPEGDGRVQHPLPEVREVKRVLYVVITAERGRAGGYNVNVLRRLQGIMDEETREFEVVAIGRKVREYLRKRGLTPLKEYVHIGDDIPYSFAR